MKSLGSDYIIFMVMYTLPKMNLYHVDTNSKIWSKSIMQAQFQSQTFPCLKKKKKKRKKKERKKEYPMLGEDGYVSRECDRYTLHQDWLTPAIWLLKSQAKKDNASIYKLKTTEVRIWYTG